MFVCEQCNFSASTNSRFKKHLLTQKHARNMFLYEESLNEPVCPIVEETSVQDSEIDFDIVQESVEENGFHIVSNDDFQPVNPIFLDINSFIFLQRIRNMIHIHPRILYIIGLIIPLFYSVQDFIFPSLNDIQYVDCTPSQKLSRNE